MLMAPIKPWGHWWGWWLSGEESWFTGSFVVQDLTEALLPDGDLTPLSHMLSVQTMASCEVLPPSSFALLHKCHVLVLLSLNFLFLLVPFSSLCTLIQNADKLYKGQLSEFTPLASLHAPSKGSSHRRGSENQRNPRRSEPFTKKVMFTRWQKAPDYCTFTPLLRFADSSRHSRQGYNYSGAGPETSV